MPQLRTLQEWMQACVMSPADLDEPTVKRRIRPSRTLTAVERLDIYRGMYELRLIDALRIDYPGLLRCLGEDSFEELARLYIREHPSQSYTLNRLGDHLPEFIPRVDGLKHSAFLRDLARFELAETLVFDEESACAAEPQLLSETVRLKQIPALRLLVLDYPAHRYLKQTKDRIPRRAKSWLVVYRKNNTVQHLELTKQTYGLLQKLCDGKTIGQALASTRLAEEQIFECFRTWFSEGFFQAL